uniref:ADF-H domain-containing protein n=1 Tax=Strigamia maritima TaxID=126957 RepID=T1IMS1_STRMM
MSHQAGIKANEKLRNFFGTCRQGNIRLVKVDIEDEQLTLSDYKETLSTWEDDILLKKINKINKNKMKIVKNELTKSHYDELILPLIESSQPCYILYRLDNKNDTGYEWLFISWSPDISTVRQKMLYASSKATLKMEFGTGQITDELFASVRVIANAPGPMTQAEEELELLKKTEVGVEIGIDTKHQTIQGVVFPISDEVINKLFDLKEDKINYIQMTIDLEKEKINLEKSAADMDVMHLRRLIPNDHARYHLFKYKHSYEGDLVVSTVFIYSTPGYNCSVKERMLYSSCKSEFINIIEKHVEIEIVRKIEIDDAEDLTEEFLLDEIHPKLNIHKQKFPKPKGPPNRGARRITKLRPEDNSPNDI